MYLDDRRFVRMAERWQMGVKPFFIRAVAGTIASSLHSVRDSHEGVMGNEKVEICHLAPGLRLQALVGEIGRAFEPDHPVIRGKQVIQFPHLLSQRACVRPDIGLHVGGDRVGRRGGEDQWPRAPLLARDGKQCVVERRGLQSANWAVRRDAVAGEGGEGGAAEDGSNGTMMGNDRGLGPAGHGHCASPRHCRSIFGRDQAVLFQVLHQRH